MAAATFRGHRVPREHRKKKSRDPQTPFSWVIEERYLEESRPNAQRDQSGWTWYRCLSYWGLPRKT